MNPPSARRRRRWLLGAVVAAALIGVALLARLGPASENYKTHCHRIDRPIQSAGTLIGDPQRFIEDAVQFRQFCCPACGGLIENEVCRAQDPVLRDVELHGG